MIDKRELDEKMKIEMTGERNSWKFHEWKAIIKSKQN